MFYCSRKTELDAIRPGLQAFLDKINGSPEPSQSLLDSQCVDGVLLVIIIIRII